MFKNLFRRKKAKREEKLLKMYNNGEYLRIDEDVDNKVFLEEKKVVPEIQQKEVVEEVVVEEEVVSSIEDEEAEEAKRREIIKGMLKEDEQKED